MICSSSKIVPDNSIAINWDSPSNPCILHSAAVMYDSPFMGDVGATGAVK